MSLLPTEQPRLLSFAGQPTDGAFTVDVDSLLEHGLFVEGTTRSGKTNLVRVLNEQTYGSVLQIILDPEGEYATLRSTRRPYLVVGKGRDVSLAPIPDVVKRLILALVDRGVSTIVDLSEYEEEEQHAIVAATCDALVSLPEHRPGNVLLTIEEMQEFAGEGGGKHTALRSVRRLAKRGLKRGVTIAGCSQRIADVSKGVVTMLKSRAIGGTDHNDVPRALDVLGMVRSDASKISELPQGQFWVKGPAFSRHAQLVRVPRSETAPEKRRRGDAPAPAPEAPAEIAALAASLAAAMAEPVEEGSAKGRSVAGVEAVMQFDEGEIARRVRQGVQVEVDVLKQEEQRRMRRTADVVESAVDDLAAGLERLRAVAGDLRQALLIQIEETAVEPRTSATMPPRVDAPPKLRRSKDAAPKTDVEGMNAGQQRILDAIAECHAIGLATPRRVQVGILAGHDISGGTPAKNVGVLIVAGHVSIPAPGTLELTTSGKQLANASARPKSRAALHERVLARLNAGQQRILRHLIAIYPESQSRKLVGTAVGHDISGGTPAKNVGRLIALDFTTIPKVGELRASDLLFPRGLR